MTPWLSLLAAGAVGSALTLLVSTFVSSYIERQLRRAITHPSGQRAQRKARHLEAPPACRPRSKTCEHFLRQVPGQLDQIALAVAASDCAVVRVRTHKLKGSCAAVGAHAMMALCANLELCPDNQYELVTMLRMQFAQIRTELLDELRVGGCAAS